MKFCELCGEEMAESSEASNHATCEAEAARKVKDAARRARRNAARRARNQAYRDLGMTRVRGNLGGTYYE